MPTDFFQRQDAARKSTAWLVVLFLLGVVGIVLAVAAVAYAVVVTTDLHKESRDFIWEIPLASGLIALLLIGLGTLYKIVALRNGGGQSVAERLGGKRLYPDASGLHERRLLNIVEEMALASGVPTPPVYLMEEQGINAFAAGYSPSDAVVAVTRGAAEGLSRDELQGVIAHEFSHILNGDMRMGIRLIGILNGILLLGLIGHGVFRIMFRGALFSGSGNRRSSSSGDSKGGGGGAIILVIIGVALALIVIGSIGSFVGGLIKAAVSRQREYLADASAVQFTRNPGGIGGALMRIGGAVFGSRLKAANAGEASHLFFAQGVWEGFSGLMATHPPLDKRIRAIDPTWDGKYLKALGPASTGSPGEGAAGLVGGGDFNAEQVGARSAIAMQDANDRVSVGVVDNAVNQIGDPDERHRGYAKQLLEDIPSPVLKAVREPYGARAVVYGLLLDDQPVVRQKQFAALAELAQPDVVELTRKLAPVLDNTSINARLPLVDLALPALRALSPRQYDQFRKSFWALVRADDRLGLFEWTLAQVLMRHLQPQFESVRAPSIQYYALSRLGEPISVLLSTLAHAGQGIEDAPGAFAAAAQQLPEAKLRLLPPNKSGLKPLQEALEVLATVAPRHRGRLIDACAESICQDGRVNVREAELLRGVSDLLDCPMPPLVAGQEVAAR